MLIQSIRQQKYSQMKNLVILSVS